MELHGKSIVGGNAVSETGSATFAASNPATQQELPTLFHEPDAAVADRALALAEAAFVDYQRQPPESIAKFLDQIGDEIMKLGDDLIRRANAETALPEARLTAERARTVGQLKIFAGVVREGSWMEAAIDRAIPDRRPAPKPDLRRMLVPLGPVVVFGASNFPLAYSVAGGDTASALAAGNPVVVKAHPAHPGTSELVARAVVAAAAASGMPPGVFALVHGASNESGLRLVTHPATKAVGFTGSLKGGRALFDAAAVRPDPIPVYAEMGSTNPVFILPGAVEANGPALAEALVQSATLGVGQFCTNPGLVFGRQDANWQAFVAKAAQLAASVAPGTMLHQGISRRFGEGAARLGQIPGVNVAGKSATEAGPGRAGAVIFSTDAETFRQQEALREELFGPSTILVNCGSTQELEAIARGLPGQLTASIHGTEKDLAEHAGLVEILRQKAGRLIFNQFPTGVEVCPSMQHGGPYPATTDSRSTSVGLYAIKRFARPVSYQNFPDAALPDELKNRNPRNLWRLVDNHWTRDAVA